MSKKSARGHIANTSLHLYLLFGLTAFFLGIITYIMITRTFAQTADTNQIYACVNKENGEMRMVKSDDACRKNENLVKWSIQGPPGPQGPAGETGGLNQFYGLPFFCTECYFAGLGDRFIEKDFSYAQIQRSDFSNSDMHGVIFKNAFLRNNNFSYTNLEDSDFSKMVEVQSAGYPQNNDFSNAKLKNADFSNSILHEFKFVNADLENVNFSGALLRSTNFKGAKNMSSANFDGATWDSVTCPDASKSYNNGNTCVGHF